MYIKKSALKSDDTYVIYLFRLPNEQPSNYRVPDFATLENSERVRLAREFTRADWEQVLADQEEVSMKPLRENLRLANFVAKKSGESRREMYERISTGDNPDTNSGVEAFGYYLALDDKSWNRMIQALREFEGMDVDRPNYVDPDYSCLPSML